LRFASTDPSRPTPSSTTDSIKAPGIGDDSSAGQTNSSKVLPPAPLDAVVPASELAERAVKEVSKKEKKPQGTLAVRVWDKVKKEAAHYWAGTKLLGQEIKISSKLLRMVLNGETLTRRERRQVGLAQPTKHRFDSC
jgi:LETM1 and EF-hand domain-containing protein 1